MELNAVYDKKFYIWGMIGLVAMCALMKATGGAGFAAIFLVVFAAFAKTRTELLLYLLLMTATLTVTNAAIAPKDFIFGVSARSLFLLVGLVMSMQIIGQRASRMITPLLSLLIYIGYMALISAVGWSPLISYLKILLFTIVFLAFFSVGNAAITRHQVSLPKLRSVFLCMASFLILGSVALIPFPGISVMSAASIIAAGGTVPEGSLFQGMTLHSQCLGPNISMLAVVLLADLLFTLRRWDKLYLLLLLCAPVIIFKTGSRTAMGTWLAGTCFVCFVFMMAHGVGAKWKNRALSTLTTLGMVGGLLLFVSPHFREQLVSFVYKARGAEVAKEDRSFEKMISTRQGLMDNQMDNFRESPIIGNGFQVAKHFQYREVTSWKSLLSAPVEKGVWVTAVLEEGGVIGLLLFLLFIVIAFTGLFKHHAYIAACALFVFLVANLGEFTFFSMSYMGGLMWAAIFAGITLDAQRLRHDRAPWFYQPGVRPLRVAPEAPRPSDSRIRA